MSSTTHHTDPTSWFNCQKPDPDARMRLFCFPYAGGGSWIYRGWEHYLPAGVEVWPVKLPGRGSRYKESPYASMSSLVSALAEAIRPFLDLPFSFFGHSMGAMMSFELAHSLRDRFDVEPSHLFLSACGGPHFPKGSPNIHHLPDEQFITELKALNGTPREVLDDPELMRLIMRALRADFEIAETHVCPPRPPVNCPITAFGGLEDSSVSREGLEAWKNQTNNSFNLWILPGDHFLLHTCNSMILQILTQEIRRILN